jgi:hypothetical protein
LTELSGDISGIHEEKHLESCRASFPWPDTQLSNLQSLMCILLPGALLDEDHVFWEVRNKECSFFPDEWWFLPSDMVPDVSQYDVHLVQLGNRHDLVDG